MSCNNSSNKNIENQDKQITQNGVPEIKFDTLFYDFGSLFEGEKVVYTFKFTNIGSAELLITDAFSTCGCTIPSFTKEPIKPGQEGRIDVVFDSSGKNGVQNKAVTIKLNTPQGEKTLWIKANVKQNNKS